MSVKIVKIIYCDSEDCTEKLIIENNNTTFDLSRMGWMTVNGLEHFCLICSRISIKSQDTSPLVSFEQESNSLDFLNIFNRIVGT